MTVEELLKTITGDSAESIKEEIVNLINIEKEKGIASYNKKDKEVMKFKNALKEIGYDSTKYDTIESFLSTYKDEQTQRENASSEEKITINSLNEKIMNLSNTLEKEAQEKTALKLKSDKEMMTNKLTQAIGEKVYGSKFLIESLILNGTVSMQDDNIVWGSGDSAVDLETGVNSFLENNKDIVKSPQNGGSGTPPTGSKEVKDFSEMSVDEASANIEELKEHYGIK